MNDLTPHQCDILIAMLQGKDIQCHGTWILWVPTTYDVVLSKLYSNPDDFRISPNQDEAVRLYGDMDEEDYGCIFTQHNKTLSDTHYIDISPNGFIVGGKIEDIAK